MVNPKVKSGSGTVTATVPELISELISELRSSFFASDFKNLATKYTEHDELMKKKYNELKKKCEEEKRLLISENLKLNNDLKKKETEIEALKKQTDEYEEKARVCKKMYMDLIKRVLVLEEKVEEYKGNQPQKTAPAESSRPTLSNEKGHSTKRIETEFKEIIEIVDDDDDNNVDDDQYIGTLKRKRVSEENKKGYNSDLKCTSTVKTKRASKEIKSNSYSDYVDNRPTGTQERKTRDESHSQRITSPDMKKVENSVASKLKKQNERWEFEADMVMDFEKDDQLCLDAVCALRRQKVIVHGSDISRYAKLTRLLMDGDLQNMPQKKASELDGSDLDDCRVLARKYSAQIFTICQKKNDPFFPPRS